MIGFNDTSMYNLSESQWITITHNKWLPKTRSILNGLWLSRDLRLSSPTLTDSLGSYMNGRLYSVSVSKEIFVEYLFTRKSVSYRVGLHGNVFVNAFHSNRSTCHNMFHVQKNISYSTYRSQCLLCSVSFFLYVRETPQNSHYSPNKLV
jgi:hypothetical protein